MSKILLDTDVVSFFFKHDSRADLYAPHLLNKTPVISFMTLAELHQWALERNWGKARYEKMEKYLQSFLVCPFDRQLCRKWAEVRVQGKRKGYSIAQADAWIAATALLHEMPLVTHNSKHYREVDGLIVISE